MSVTHWIVGEAGSPEVPVLTCSCAMVFHGPHAYGRLASHLRFHNEIAVTRAITVEG